MGDYQSSINNLVKTCVSEGRFLGAIPWCNPMTEGGGGGGACALEKSTDSLPTFKQKKIIK